jgi:hypothetical protein
LKSSSTKWKKYIYINKSFGTKRASSRQNIRLMSDILEPLINGVLYFEYCNIGKHGDSYSYCIKQSSKIYTC